MSANTHTPVATLSSDWMAAYSAGGLSSAKRVVVDCQAALRPEFARGLRALDHVSGALIENIHGEDMSDSFYDRIMADIDAPAEHEKIDRVSAQGEAWMPAPLRDYIADSGIKLKWRAAGLGVAHAPLTQSEDGEMLYLLRAAGGTKLPEHTHRGEEWTLILQGGYHVGEQGFVAGDLHVENEECVHRPVIDAGEACISLVAIEGKLRFSNPLLRLLQPLFGV